ncbi:hypothetical protein FBY22_3732 [Streptomyces sp. SLBN-31]|nr:hypothetical protein FBY22_3979 [Streptomyces sp. SLBN-31]TQJ92800.1 hypothetical protein FBY22_3732 [Streptomyces sp. SLBN-31]
MLGRLGDHPFYQRLGKGYESPSQSWTVCGVLAGAGCLLAALGFLAVWVNGLVALFD